MPHVVDLLAVTENNPGAEIVFDVDGRFVHWAGAHLDGATVVVSLTEHEETDGEPVDVTQQPAADPPGPPTEDQYGRPIDETGNVVDQSAASAPVEEPAAAPADQPESDQVTEVVDE